MFGSILFFYYSLVCYRTKTNKFIQQTTNLLVDNDHALLVLEPGSMDQIDYIAGTEYALAMDDVLVKPIYENITSF